MTFMRNMAGFGRALGTGAKVGKACSFVTQYFHLPVSTEMIERARPEMTRWADTSSVAGLSLIYLWQYSRKVMNLGTDAEKAELRNQFEIFITNVKALQDRGETLGEYPLMFFCEAAAHCGADPSPLRAS